MIKISRYCEECLVFARQHCVGKEQTTKANDAVVHFGHRNTHSEQYETRQDYIQTGADGALHGLHFCNQYELNPAMLSKLKSAQATRDEFNARRAANKAAAEIQKAEERKQKAKDRQKVKKAEALKQKIRDAQRVAERVTQQVMQPETLSQAVNNALDDFSDLII